MTALAQGSAGVALVMGFALLRTGQVRAAAILLMVQCSAVAVTAVVLHQPLMAAPPLLLGAGFWLLRLKAPMFQPLTVPTGGAKLALVVGAVVAILCQSQGDLALPAAILLLSVLLAATRSHRLMQVAALVGAQNGVVLGASLAADVATGRLQGWMLAGDLILAIACLVLPLPLAAGLLMRVVEASPRSVRAFGPPAAWRSRLSRAFPATLSGWIDVGLALAVLAATLIVPLDDVAAIFAPLLALDGLVRAWPRRNPRGSVVLQTGFSVLAVCAADLRVAWLAVLAGMAMALVPTMSRRWSDAILAFLGAGISLFGISLLPVAPSLLGYFSLFAGFATIAAVVPELVVVLVILLLRLGDHTVWPSGIGLLGIGIAAACLLGCAILLTNAGRARRATLLVLGQSSMAALAICTGFADARFAALVLLVLLILSRAAARVTAGPVAALAMAALGGLPPFGVFPGVVLVVLSLSAHLPWLLLPWAAALIPMALASAPTRLPAMVGVMDLRSIGWLPLLLAIAAGYFAPSGVVHWWRIVTAGGT